MEDEYKKRLTVLSEIQVRYAPSMKAKERIKINNPYDAHDIFRKIWSDQMDFIEQIYALFLDRGCKVLGFRCMSTGNTFSSVMDMKTLFAIALKVNAHGIILAHNHPSGNLAFSDADKKLTAEIEKGCTIFNMQFTDHLILTTEGCYSHALGSSMDYNPNKPDTPNKEKLQTLETFSGNQQSEHNYFTL